MLGSIISHDVDIYTENFIKNLDRLYCSYFPLKTKFVSERNFSNRWMTSELQNLLNAKSDYFYLCRMGNRIGIEFISREENSRFKNKITNLIRKHKKKYYRDLIKNCRNDLRKTWKVINCLLSKGHNNNVIRNIVVNNITYSNEEDIANVFNDYFCNIGTHLDSIIPMSISNPLQYVEINNESNFHLYSVSSSEVTEIVKSLKTSKNDIENISVSLLKDYSNIFSLIIANIINLCFRIGKFPNCLKKAVITPLFKKGDKLNIENYRPISKLPILSKIFEKAIKARLVKFIDETKILCKTQFGFQRGLSTQDAILNVIEQLYENLNNYLYSIGIFIDFSKAFDTITHEILLNKLRAFGIRGVPLKLFAS